MVAIRLDRLVRHLTVRGRGTGPYDENAAGGRLLKGKITTMAERHSGEGIPDDRTLDVIVKQLPSPRGTEIRFRVSYCPQSGWPQEAPPGMGLAVCKPPLQEVPDFRSGSEPVLGSRSVHSCSTAWSRRLRVAPLDQITASNSYPAIIEVR